MLKQLKILVDRDDEGYLLQVSPLFSTDGRSVDVDIRCRVRQVERLVPVMVESPRGTTGPTRLQIQVPQMSQKSQILVTFSNRMGHRSPKLRENHIFRAPKHEKLIPNH